MDIRKKDILIITIFTLLFSTIFITVPFYNIKENNSYEIYSKEEVIENIDPIKEIADEYDVNVEEIKTYKINNKYTNISFEKTENYVSKIIDNKTNENVSIDNILKNDQLENFYNLIKEQTEIKYPLFINQELNKDTTTKTYYFEEDGILIYFSNYETTPVYTNETYIKLTCDMLSDIVNYKCDKLTEYNPNEIILDKTKKSIAITFDDGPNKNTLSIIDTLKDNKATATFFVVGTNFEYQQDKIQKELENGNEVGSHSYSHKNLNKQKGLTLDFEMNRVSEIYKELTGNEIKLLRPPYGCINNEIKTKYNYSYILWSVDPEDWKYKDAEIVKDHVLDTVEDGDIVLLHDIHLSTAEALKLILPELYVRGYQVVSVSKLAELKDASLNNNEIYRSFK